MEKELMSFNKKNQYSKNIVNISQCETHKEVDLTVNMCSYFPDSDTYSVSFSPCEIDKNLNISTPISCNSLNCNYIDSLIYSASFCICEESYCNCGDNPVSDNNCLSIPCDYAHEIFIDASECKEDLDNDSEGHSYHSELDSQDTVNKDKISNDTIVTNHIRATEDSQLPIAPSIPLINLLSKNSSNKDVNEERISDGTIVSNHIESTEDSNKKKPDSQLSIAALIPLIALLLKNPPNKDVNEEGISDGTTVSNHIESTEESHKKKPDSQLSIALLVALIDMFLKNSPNKGSNEDGDNAKERSKRHKNSKHHKHHKHNKRHKHDKHNNSTINGIIILLIFALLSRFKY